MVKRRINRKKSKRKAISIVLFAFLFVSIGAGYSIINTNLNLFGQSNLTMKLYDGIGTVELNLTNVATDTPNVYEYNYSVKITNTGINSINGWLITFDVPTGATVTSNNGIATVSDEEASIRNQAYNRTIATNTTYQDMNITVTTSQQDYKFTYLTFNGMYMQVGEEVIDPTGMSLNITSTTIYEGDKVNLIPIYTPANATATGTVSWASNNTNVATVDSNGIVTGVSQGNAVITATYEGLSARCNIAVTTTHTVTEDLDVVFKKSNSYPGQGGGYVNQFDVTIENISGQSITSWSFDLVLPANASIIGSWGINMTKTGNTYTFYNFDWNGNIPAGGFAQSVGIQIQTPFESYTPIATNIITTK